MTKFGERLKRLRKEANMTQKQLAKCIWVTKATISNYELYERMPPPEILVKIASVFHVSTDYLLGLEQNASIDISGLDDTEIKILYELIQHFLKLKKKNVMK